MVYSFWSIKILRLVTRSVLRLMFSCGLIITSAPIWLFVIAKAVEPPPDGGYPGNNTAEGTDALFSLTDGAFNTAVGFDALYNTTIGGTNTAVGDSALFSNTIGIDNTANGFHALYYNTTGFENTAVGSYALYSNATGFYNTAIGEYALGLNTTGAFNTACGYFALYMNTGGANNTAEGFYALYYNTTGNYNTAGGKYALLFNTSGIDNTAEGAFSLENNTTGSKNTALGFNALSSNTTGGNNVALGQSAGANLTTGNGNIDIGNAGVAGEAKTIRIGNAQINTYIAGINGVTVAGGVGVLVDSNGHLGTTTSSARYKDAIQPMDKASEGILALRPVTFRYKHELDPDGIPQFGLVAEDVAKVNPALVARDEQGKPYAVRYDAVNAMLLNEFLKEHHQVQNLKAMVAEQQKQIEALTAGLQRMSAQLELSKPTTHTVLNNH
jgi:hypothetical protein